MKLTHWRLENYKTISQGELAIDDLNILIGENNSGKSNVLDSLKDLQRVWDGTNDDRWFTEHVIAKDISQTISFELTFSLDTEERIQILEELSDDDSQRAKDQEYITTTVMEVKLNQDGRNVNHNINIKVNWENELIDRQELNRLAPGPAHNTLYEHVDKTIDSWKFVTPFRHPDDMGVSEYTSRDLKPGGSNLVQKLNSLRMSDQEDLFDRICEAYIQVMEGVTRVDTKYDQDHSQDNRITIVVEETGFNSTFKFSEISSGSKEILVLIAQIFLAYEDTNLLIIEEPELHLHPGAEQKIYEIIKELTESTNTQVILSTHSDVFVNQSDTDSIVRVERNGKTNLRKLDEGEIGDELVDLGYDKSGLLQSNAVVFVEGLSDKLILSQWAATLGVNITDEGITIVELEGEGNIGTHGRSLVKLLYSFEIPYLFVVDSDDGEPGDVIREYKRKINREDDDIAEEKVWWHTTPDHFHAWSDSDIEHFLLQAPQAIADTVGEDRATIAETIEGSDADENADVLAELWDEYYTDPEGITSYQKDLHGKMIAKQMDESEMEDEILTVIEEIEQLV